METALDFIRDFKLSSFGLTKGDMLIILGGIILFLMIGNWLASFLEPKRAQRTKKILSIMSYSLFYGGNAFWLLHLLLIKDYGSLGVVVFLLLFANRHELIDKFYKGYDRLVDRVINLINK